MIQNRISQDRIEAYGNLWHKDWFWGSLILRQPGVLPAMAECSEMTLQCKSVPFTSFLRQNGMTMYSL